MPLAIPAFSADEAARQNRIAQWRVPLPLPGNEAYALHRLERPEAEPGRPVERLVIDLAIGADRMQATMPRSLLLDLLRSLDNALLFDPLPPPDLMALLLEAALLPLIELLERTGGRPVVVHAVASAEREGLPCFSDRRQVQSTASGVGVLIGIRGPGLRQTLTIEAATDAIDRLLRDWTAGRRPMQGLSIPAVLVGGETLLTPRLVGSLRIGDVVLIQDQVAASSRAFSGDGVPSVLRLIVADTLSAIARISEARWRLDGPLQQASRMDQTVSDTAASDPNDDAPIAGQLDEIPIRLVFEAARLELPLGSLRQLRAGSILDVEGVPGTVRIMVNGRRIGDGELVSIDGRAGVRITGFIPDLDGQPA